MRSKANWPISGILLLVTAFGTPAAQAQLTTGAIQGAVTDETGDALQGAEVGVKNVDTGLTRALLTNSQGRFEAPNLPVGNYEVTASLRGFGTAVRRGIALAVGRTAVVDMTLRIATRQEETVVTADASLVETTSATVSNLIDEKKVQELPIVNRDLTQLAFLQPGVIKSSAGQAVFAGQGDKLAVAGARGTQNLYLLDGVSNGDVSGNPQGASGVYMGSETIKEIQIVTNNYSAEYRSAMGAIVSAVTKSGTNKLHGSASEFYRNDGLNSPNYFDEKFGNPEPDYKRNHFGASLGGPLVKDKLFFFMSYEGLREDQGSTQSINVPSAAARLGRLASATLAVNPTSAKVLALYPVPGQGNQIVQDNGDTVLIAGTRNRNTENNFAVGKLDYLLSPKNTLSLTFNYDKGEVSDLGVLRAGAGAVGSSSNTRVVSTRWTTQPSNASLNELHFGYGDSEPSGELPLSEVDFAGQGLLFREGRTLMGEVNIPGVTSIGYRVAGSAYRQRSYTLKDAFSLSAGSHTLRLGGEWTYYRYNVGNCSRGCQGVYDFSNMQNFLRGIPRRFEVLLPGGDVAQRDMNQQIMGAYVQDNWRVGRSLTLNLGVRYEYATTIQEKDDQVSNLRDFFTDREVTRGILYDNPSGRAISPRVGFVWAPGGGRSSLRGGFGIFYEHVNLFLLRTSLQELPPFTLVGRIDQADANRVGQEINWPNAGFTQLALARGRPNIRTFQYDLDQTHSYRWSGTYQRQFGKDWVATVDYTGSRGRNLWQQSLANIRQWQGFPSAVPSSEKFFAAGAPLINPNFGEVRLQYTNASSWYNGVSAGIQRRPSAGLRVGAAFTYGKAIDEASGVTSGGEELPQSQRGIYAYDRQLMRGLASFDARKAFTANFAYELPWGKDLKGATAVFAKGWQVNGIVTVQDGYPLSVLEDSDAQIARLGDDEDLRPDLVPGGNNNPVTGNPDRWYDVSQFRPARIGYFGNLGRNTVIGPKLATVDLSLLKNTAVGSSTIQLRVEAFNLFDRANFGTPNMTAFINEQPNPLAGRITTTRTPARRVQLGVRWLF